MSMNAANRRQTELSPNNATYVLLIFTIDNDAARGFLTFASVEDEDCKSPTREKLILARSDNI